VTTPTKKSVYKLNANAIDGMCHNITGLLCVTRLLQVMQNPGMISKEMKSTAYMRRKMMQM